MTKINEFLEEDRVKTCILLSPSGFPTSPHGKLITYQEIPERLKLKMWKRPDRCEGLTLQGAFKFLAYAQGPNRQGVRTIEIGGRLFHGNVLIHPVAENALNRDLSEEESGCIQKLCCDFTISQLAADRLLELRVGVYIAAAVLEPGMNGRPRGRALMVSNDLESFYKVLGSTSFDHSFLQLRSGERLHALSAYPRCGAKGFYFRGDCCFGTTVLFKEGPLYGADSLSEKNFEEIAQECEAFNHFDQWEIK